MKNTMNILEMKNRLKKIIEKRSLKRGEFTLASGRKSNFYFNLKETIFYPESSLLIADLMVEQIGRNFPKYVGGLEMGAVPLAAYVGLRSEQLGKPIQPFFVRKIAKDHGTQRRIDIDLIPGSRVVVLEDVTTSGNSAIIATQAVRDIGCEVDTVVTLLDRQEGARKSLSKEGIELQAIFEAEDFNLIS